jgi:hypothetical protein
VTHRRGTQGKHVTVAVAVGAALVALAGGARAGDVRCPVPAGAWAALEGQGAAGRLAVVREVMRHQAARARTWSGWWTGIGFGLAAIGYAQLPFLDADKRLVQVVTSTSPLTIPLQLALLPLGTGRYDDELEAYLATTSTPSGEMEPCLRLARAEELLAKAAEDEAEHAGILQHIATIVLSGAYTAFLAVAFHDLQHTLVDGVGSVFVGEAQILTQPTGAVRALEQYRQGDLASAPRSAVIWSVGPAPAGVGGSLAVHF